MLQLNYSLDISPQFQTLKPQTDQYFRVNPLDNSTAHHHCVEEVKVDGEKTCG